MDRIDDDLHKAGIPRYHVTTAWQRPVSLQEISEVMSQWRELLAASMCNSFMNDVYSCDIWENVAGWRGGDA